MVAITGQGSVRLNTDTTTTRADPLRRADALAVPQQETLFDALPRRTPLGHSSGSSSRLRPRSPTPVSNDPGRNALALGVVVENSSDPLVRLTLRNSIASYLDPALRRQIDAEAIVNIGLPAVNTASKFAALVSDTGLNECGGATVLSLPQHLMLPVLIELGLHILHMPPDEREAAARVYVQASSMYQGPEDALYSSLIASAEEGPTALAYQVIDTLGKASIRAGHRPEEIAVRLGVVDQQSVLIVLAQQYARGAMND